jgi:hypothetical protein
MVLAGAKVTAPYDQVASDTGSNAIQLCYRPFNYQNYFLSVKDFYIPQIVEQPYRPEARKNQPLMGGMRFINAFSKNKSPWTIIYLNTLKQCCCLAA